MYNIGSEIIYHPLFILALIAEFIIKGMALWRSGRNNQPGWFIFLFIVTSGGIIPLIYLIFFQKKRKVY
jgi:hypothetical protein